jgi:hypothetical protein
LHALRYAARLWSRFWSLHAANALRMSSSRRSTTASRRCRVGGDARRPDASTLEAARPAAVAVAPSSGRGSRRAPPERAGRRST